MRFYMFLLLCVMFTSVSLLLGCGEDPAEDPAPVAPASAVSMTIGGMKHPPETAPMAPTAPTAGIPLFPKQRR